MSRQYETYVSTEHRTRLVNKTCDMCGKVCVISGSFDNWTKDPFEFAETTVEIETGSRYPEGGSGIKTSFDICPDCFQDKLIPFIISCNGAKPTVEEIDY